MSLASITTSTSPAIPVAFCSVRDVLERGQVLRHELGHVGLDRASACRRPSRAAAMRGADGEHPLGPADGAAQRARRQPARAGGAACEPRAWRRRCRPRPGAPGRPRARRGPGGRLPSSRSAAAPARNVQASATHDADHEHEAEAADHRHRREQRARGSRPRWPARRWRWSAPPRAAARSTSPPSSSTRDWNWIAVVDGEADQHGQHGDRGHRQRRPDDAQRAERRCRRAPSASPSGQQPRAVRAAKNEHAAPSRPRRR